MRQSRPELTDPVCGGQHRVVLAAVAVPVRHWVSLFLMLVLAIQGTAAPVQHPEPAHYHVELTPQTVLSNLHGGAHAHHHARISHHAHAQNDRSVVIVGDVDPAQPALATEKPNFDGFVLALPPDALLIDSRNRDLWVAAVSPGFPSHRSLPPERPPRPS